MMRRRRIANTATAKPTAYIHTLCATLARGGCCVGQSGSIVLDIEIHNNSNSYLKGIAILKCYCLYIMYTIKIPFK